MTPRKYFPVDISLRNGIIVFVGSANALAYRWKKQLTCGRGGTADALASGASGGNLVMVQIHSTAPKFLKNHPCAVVAEWQTHQLEGLAGATLCWFKSSLPHQTNTRLLGRYPRGFFIV
jgi:hypothetical protein